MRSLGLAFFVFLAGCDSCSSKPHVTIVDAAPAATLIPDAAPMNATPIGMATVQRAVNPQKLPAYAGATGSIEGTIKVSGPAAPALGLSSATFTGCPDAEKLYGKEFREGPPPAGNPAGPRWLADAIVVITGYGGFFVPEKDEAEEVTIEGCGYKRRTVTMTFGQRLEVKNLTKEFWTPDLDPRQPGALMMATPNGDPVKLYPKQAGRYHLVDHDRKYVVDDLFVFLHPLHAVTDLEGHYRIDGVPVGHVQVNATHPRIDAESIRGLDITANVVSQVDLVLNYNPAPPTDAGVDADTPKPYPGLH